MYRFDCITEVSGITVKAIFLGVMGALAVGYSGHAKADGTDNDQPWLELGGAVRFNYGWLDYGPTSGLQPELLRADLKAGAGPLSTSVQYRWYDGFDAVHHAWVAWDGEQGMQVKAGIQQVPFGLLPTASQSFWFGAGYYLGLEDDYDPGVVVAAGQGATRGQVGWFSGDEYGSARRYDRYSFDVAATDALPYRERGRVHGRIEHTLEGPAGTWQLGASGFHGKVQHTLSRRHHDHYGAALHAQWQHAGWTGQLQWARYRYDVPGGRIALSAFQAPFPVAAHADVSTANLARSFGARAGLDDVTCYNNLSLVRPLGKRPGQRESWQNVSGCSLSRGPMVTYVDWIAGKDMWFAGGQGVGIVDDAPSRWRSRLNLNIGFYF